MGDLQILSKLYVWGALLEDLLGVGLTWGGQYSMSFWSGVWLTYKTLVGPPNSDGTLTWEGRALITMGPVRWEPLVAHGTWGLLQL